MFQVGAKITIDPIDNTHGILLFKEGQILKQNDTFNLACTYNITHLQFTFKELISLYASTKNAEVNTSSERIQKAYRDQIEYKLDLINKKLLFLNPTSRVKRGILNGLGSVVKVITGNLDDNDAIRFENEINKIRSSVNSIQNFQRHSITLANSTINEFSDQLSKINENQHRLTFLLRNITFHSNIFINQLHFLEIYVQLGFSLQSILDRLMLLEDAMTFSKLGVMHPSILSPRNLILELLNLQRIYSFKTVTEINIIDINKIEQSITVKAYSTEHFLTFILEIPSIAPEIYDYVHLYSIPDKYNLTIIPQSKFLVLGNEGYAYLSEGCRKISEGMQLCKSLEIKSIENSEDCIIALIKHQRANCTQARIHFKLGKLQKVSEMSWLAVLQDTEVIRTQCGLKTGYQRISGIVLITITDDCIVQVMNTTLRTHIKTISINEVIPLPKVNSLFINEVRYEIHLEDISLDSIHQLANSIQTLEEDDEIDWPIIMAVPSWPTIIIYIFIIIFIMRKIYKHLRRVPEKISSEDASGTCRTSFHLKEGGVNNV